MHILRRTKKQLKDQCKLPERKEFIVTCKMTDYQLNLYSGYVKDCQTSLSGLATRSDRYAKNMFYSAISQLRKLCIHPILFYDGHINSEISIKYGYPNLETTREYKQMRS